MINKLISKSEVRLLEWDGIQSNDYVDGFCDAIQKVIDLEPIPTFGVDEVEKIRAEIQALDEGYTSYQNDNPWIYKSEVLAIIDKHIAKAESEDKE